MRTQNGSNGVYFEKLRTECMITRIIDKKYVDRNR